MRFAETFDLADLDIGTLDLPSSGENVIRDSAASGLALRLRSSGSRTWVLLTKENGKAVRRTLGDASTIPLAVARAMVSTVPIVPASASASAPKADPLFKPYATIADLFPRYLAYGEQAQWKSGSVRNVESIGRLRIIPTLGYRKVSAVTAQDVARWYQDISGQAKAARNALTILSGLMLYAEDHGLRPVGSNPCQGLRKKTITQRGSHLPATTIRALWRALDRLQSVIPDACDAVRLLLLTGARRSEILGLEWDRIVGSRAVLEDSKTGPRTVWLCAAARHILDRRRLATDSAFVFPGPKTKRPITAIDREWSRILKQARIKALRVHDLRHHFASVAVSNGVDLRVIGQLLGHRDIESTLGYAHLATDALVKSAGRVSTMIGDAMRVDDSQIRSDLRLPSTRKKLRVKPRVQMWKAIALRNGEARHV